MYNEILCLKPDNYVSVLNQPECTMVHVTIVGFVRSSCRTIAVRHDVCGHGSEEITSLCLFTVQPSPTDQTNKPTDQPEPTNFFPTRKPPLKFQRFFFWLKPPNFSVANQHQPTNPTAYKPLEGMVHCRNLAVST